MLGVQGDARTRRGTRGHVGAQGARGGTAGARGKARHDAARRAGARVRTATRPTRHATRHRVRAAWAQCPRGLCVLAGPGWVLCAPDSVLTEFLDSILLLSHFLGTVHHKKKIQNFFLIK